MLASCATAVVEDLPGLGHTAGRRQQRPELFGRPRASPPQPMAASRSASRRYVCEPVEDRWFEPLLDCEHLGAVAGRLGPRKRFEGLRDQPSNHRDRPHTIPPRLAAAKIPGSAGVSSRRKGAPPSVDATAQQDDRPDLRMPLGELHRLIDRRSLHRWPRLSAVLSTLCWLAATP